MQPPRLSALLELGLQAKIIGPLVGPLVEPVAEVCVPFPSFRSLCSDLRAGFLCSRLVAWLEESRQTPSSTLVLSSLPLCCLPLLIN